MKITAIDACVLTVPTPKPMALEFPHHRLVRAHADDRYGAGPAWPNLTLGNVYNVTESNSSAPQTELEVVSRHSYGRQLGRITDALSVVIGSGVLEKEELSGADHKRLDDFLKLAQCIEEIKTREAMKRVERVAAELAHLKQTRPDNFQRALELLDPIMRG